MTTNLKIKSLIPFGGPNLSLEGSDKTSAKVNIQPLREVEVSVRSVQFDQAWLELLAQYVEQGKAETMLEGYVLSPADIRELQHTDVNEIMGQYFESKERGAPAANPAHGRYYSGSDGHPHYRAGNGADYDLTLGGTYLEQVTHRIYVDGGRTDVYVETGAITRPFKTIMAAIAASSPGDCLSIACANYVENVVMVGDRHIDADPGTALTAPTGCPLTITDSPVPPGGFPIMFMRGLNVVNQDASDWSIIVRSTGTWQPFLVMLDNLVGTVAGGSGFWADGGGFYCTDAGGMIGDPAIGVRVGAPGTQRGGQFQAGKFNLSCAFDGIMFDIYENGNVLADGTGISSGGGSSPTSAILARMDGGPGGPGHGSASFYMRNAQDNSDWGGAVRAVGNCQVQIIGDELTQYDRYNSVVFAMAEGSIDLLHSKFSSRNDVVFALGSVGKHININMKDVEGRTGGALARVLEVVGDTNATFDTCHMQCTNPGAAFGVAFLNCSGNVAIMDGSYEGAGPVIDQRQGHLWLVGGVDLVPTGMGLPGSVPLAVAMGATVHRGHCNFRSGTPIIAGTEDILNSSFGSMSFGPGVYMVRQGAGSALPGGGSGYGRGSLFVLVPMPAGTPVVYINTGTEAAPVWSVSSNAYAPAVPGDWAGVAPTTLTAAMDRVAAILRTHLGAPIP